MSVKELVLKDESLEIKIKIEAEQYCFYCEDKDWLHSFRLDRNQAHLLYLYLQEHLGFNIVPTIPKDYYQCKCGKLHQKNFVCERLGSVRTNDDSKSPHRRGD